MLPSSSVANLIQVAVASRKTGSGAMRAAAPLQVPELT